MEDAVLSLQAHAVGRHPEKGEKGGYVPNLHSTFYF